CAGVIPLQNTNPANAVGKPPERTERPFCTLRFAVRRAYQLSAPGNVSTRAPPLVGTCAVAKIISRTRAEPSLVTTPGTVTPASEWPTITRSSSAAFSMSDTSELTHPSIQAVVRSPALFRRPGKSTVSTFSSGSTLLITSTVGSQQSAANPPPCTRTNAGNPIAGSSFSVVSPGPHLKRSRQSLRGFRHRRTQGAHSVPR